MLFCYTVNFQIYNIEIIFDSFICIINLSVEYEWYLSERKKIKKGELKIIRVH